MAFAPPLCCRHASISIPLPTLSLVTLSSSLTSLLILSSLLSFFGLVLLFHPLPTSAECGAWR